MTPIWNKNLLNDIMLSGANQMKNKNLSLIGCGWLGKPLATQLIKNCGSLVATTARDRAAEFEQEGIPYVNYDLTTRAALPEKILNTDILIYMIPPLDMLQMKDFFDQIPTDKKIIFISSTSVYGKKLGEVDEETSIDIEQTNSPLLVETEKYLKSRFESVTILRLGGLYGQKRHPIYFLQGKENVLGANEYLHLVHQKDCVDAITSVLEQDLWNETFNIVSDLRVKKSEYYTRIAEKLSLLPPVYKIHDQESLETKISNEKSKHKLKLNYRNPNDYTSENN
jgi:nucleoside-diphosphate-sugar epimerase